MLTLYRHTRPMRLAEAMSRMFDESLAPAYPSALEYRLPLDVVARADEYVITAAVPGLRAEDLQLEVLGDTISLRAELPAPAEDKDAAWLLQERRFGRFSRTLTLPAELDGAKAEASLENGVLSLRVPKAETAKPKAIKVKAR